MRGEGLFDEDIGMEQARQTFKEMAEALESKEAAAMRVGRLTINCPACGEEVLVNVRIASIEEGSPAYFHVKFQDANPKHECAGRR